MGANPQSRRLDIDNVSSRLQYLYVQRSCYKWTPEMLARKLTEVCASLGRFPTQSDCKVLGLSGFYAALCRNGGLKSWWAKMEPLGFGHNNTDTEYGWNGEAAVLAILQKEGVRAEKPESSKCYYDLLVDGVLRLDVKTTTKTNSPKCSDAWYYRIGKQVTVDVVVLYQADTGNVFFIPWYLVSATNITVGVESKWDGFKNNFVLLGILSAKRIEERAMAQKIVDAKIEQRNGYLQRVVQLRSEGLTYKMIGNRLNVCPQNIQKLLEQAEKRGITC